MARKKREKERKIQIVFQIIGQIGRIVRSFAHIEFLLAKIVAKNKTRSKPTFTLKTIT